MTLQTVSGMPQVKAATVTDLVEAVKAGWRDVIGAGWLSLLFGVFFTLGGLAVVAVVLWVDAHWLAYPIAAGFPLIGPFAAVGLYEISRTRAAGLRPTLGGVLRTVWKQGGRELAWMAFAMLFVFWIWIYQVRLLMALFLGWSLTGTLDNFFGVLFSTQEGMLFLLVGHVIGAMLALFLFSMTVVSIPLLLERDVDIVTAIVTSIRAVAASPVVMLGWGCAVTLIFIAGCLPAFLGLIVVIPVLGHATWHLYRRLVPAA